MKLKYYLRGIGIGVILTAIVMGFALGGRKTTMSDAEVIERAKELGMTDGGVLSDTVNEGDEVEESNTSSSDQALDEAGKEISKEIDEAFASANESASFLASKEEEGKDKEAKEEKPVTEASFEASKELDSEKTSTKVLNKVLSYFHVSNLEELKAKIYNELNGILYHITDISVYSKYIKNV